MALIAEQVGFYYKENQWVFQNVNLRVDCGAIIGISGYSGCGKSTFAKILAHFLLPVQGEISVDGHPFKKGIYQPVQLILQHPEKALNPKWRMYRSLHESYTPDQALLERFGIRKEWLNRFPIEISGGEMQRFCIVRALHPETKYIIADEMTTMLDSYTQAYIWRVFLEICAKRQIGVVIISHEAEILSRLCDDVIAMKNL